MRILLSVVLCAFAGTAHADYAKAWKAAKANLPATTRAIAMLDLAVIDRSPHFVKLWSAAIAAERELAEIDRELKQTCKIDISRVAEGLVIAGDPKTEQVVFFLQLGVDRGKASACFETLMTRKAGQKVRLKQEGIYTIFANAKSTRAVYAAWVAPNVVAFTLDPESKPALAAWLGRKGFASSPVAPLLAKTDPEAIAAGAFAVEKPLDRKSGVRSGYGHVLMNGQNLTASFVAIAPDASSAAAGAADLDKESKRELTRRSLSPAVKNVISKLVFAARGNHITLQVAGTVKDLADAAAAELKPKQRKIEAPAPPTP